MINIKNIGLIWSKLITDLDEEDIVLEVKLLNTTIEDYNKLLKHIKNFHAFPMEYTYGGKKQMIPQSINNIFFDDDSAKELKVNLGRLTISNSFFESNEIEFYTDSVLNLNSQDVVNFFSFIEWIGEVMEMKVLIFIQSYRSPSVTYNFKKKLYKTYIYSDWSLPSTN